MYRCTKYTHTYICIYVRTYVQLEKVMVNVFGTIDKLPNEKLMD